jgi:hypothetical protein
MLKKGTRQDAGLIRQGSYQGASDIQDHYWFDTLPIQGSNISLYNFFTSPISATKVAQQTNLQDAGKFPTGQSFVTNAIGFRVVKLGGPTSIVSQSINEIYTVLENSNVELIIAGREFDFQAPASAFLPAVSSASSDVTGGADASLRVGDFNQRNWLPLKTPITISELVSFKVALTVNNADANVATALNNLNALGIELRWVLRGTLERLK